MNCLSVLRDAAYFFQRNLPVIAALCLPALIVETLAQGALRLWLGEDANQAYGLIVGIMCYPLYAAPLISFVRLRQHSEQVDRAAIWRITWAAWPRFVVLTGVSTLAIILGLSLLILPGLYVLVRLAFAELTLIHEGLSPFQAIGRSLEMTQGRFWLVASSLLAVMVPIWLLSALSEPAEVMSLGWLVHQVIFGLTQLFALVVLMRLYLFFGGARNQ